MGNWFFGASYKLTHPCAIVSCGSVEFKCICGQVFKSVKEITDHQIAKHTQEENKEIMSGKYYDKAYNTPEYQERAAKAKKLKEDRRKLIQAGFKPVKSKILRGSFLNPSGKIACAEDIEAIIGKNNYI